MSPAGTSGVLVQELAERIRQAGGRALVVGGAVRDRLRGRAPTDVDVEVYGLAPEVVARIAGELGEVREVGKAFGVLLLRAGGEEVHVSLPRRESKVAPGHRGFTVGVDPALTPEEAAHRRDFTLNAVAEDPLTKEIIDPVNGREDLQQRILRVVDPEHFGDDPLRVLRGAVFTAQFSLTVDPLTEEVLRRTAPSLRQLPKERVGEEWRKLLLRPERPSRGLALLTSSGALDVLHPEFGKLAQTPQNPKWHPEGDVWTHTLLAVDEAARVVREQGGGEREQGYTEDERWWVMLAILCHDLGKATTTGWLRGAWRSPGHDAASVEPTRAFLRAIAVDHRTTEVVVRLVREHLQPLRFVKVERRGEPVPDGEVFKLARRAWPATIALLSLVAAADHRGRGPFPGGVPPPGADAGPRLRERAERLGVLAGPPAPVLRGADLLALGLSPSPAFGEILRRAEALREERGATRGELLDRLRGVTSAADALACLQ